MATIDLGPELEAFRTEIREWIKANAPDEVHGIDHQAIYGGGEGLEESYSEAQMEAYREWERKMLDARLICAHWPEEVGGRGLSGVHMAILNEEFHRANVPRITRGMGESLVGPSIVVHGTEEQKKAFLSRIISGEDRYCQGFSEPDNGSDLGGVQTRGVVDGDEVVISGQKVWTSGAHLANMIFILCRTDPTVPKHRGLSYVLAPMENNGIELRTIRQPTGRTGFSEEFIDGCRAPLFNIIGGLNNGWRVAMTTLGNERGGNATTQHLRYEKEFWDLVDEARKRGKDTDRITRQRLAWSYTHVEIMRYAGLRLLAQLAQKKEPGPEASTSKLFWSEYHKIFGEYAVDLVGAEGMLAKGNDIGGQRNYKLDKWQDVFLQSRPGTIFSGTSQIQRNIIGERALGLPKEPQVEKPREAAGQA